MLDGLQNLQLTKEEEDSIQISSHSRDELLEECHLSLFGKLLSDRQQNQRALKSTLRSVWRMGSDLRIVEVGNDILQFKFCSKHQLEWVEKNGPWNFDNNLLLLGRWRKGLTAANIIFSHTPFWVQVWGVPFELMTEETGRDIGNSMGNFVEMDKRSSQMDQAKFMRVRVELPIDKPLRRGGYLMDMEGDKTWVTFKYERLPTICFLCGKIGHDKRHCNSTVDSHQTEYQYGDWIRANGNYKGSNERVKTRKDEGNQSSGDGGKSSSQPSTEGTKNLVRIDDGGGSKRSDSDRREGKSENWGAQGDGMVSGRQAASHPRGWDSTEEGAPTIEKEEQVRASPKVLNFELDKGKEKVCTDVNSVVGSQLVGLREEHEVTSPLKPKQSTKAESEMGYLDMGQCKEKKPKTKGRLKKLARERGPSGDEVMLDREGEIGLKRKGKLEKLEGEEARTLKKKCVEVITSDTLVSAETAEAERQPRREP